jgi:hypothetical protein
MNTVYLSSCMQFFAFNYIPNNYEDLEEDFIIWKYNSVDTYIVCW